MTFGQTLARFREDREMSQGQLARLANYDPSFISRLEKDLRVGTLDVVKRLADELELSHQEFLELRTAAGHMPEDWDIATFTRLPRRIRRQLLQIAPILQENEDAYIRGRTPKVSRARSSGTRGGADPEEGGDD